MFYCEEKGYFLVVSVGQLSFDCRTYCRLSRRMQGRLSIRLRPRPEVSQHDAIFSSDAIFSGESLLLDVNFGPKISRRRKYHVD